MMMIAGFFICCYFITSTRINYTNLRILLLDSFTLLWCDVVWMVVGVVGMGWGVYYC